MRILYLSQYFPPEAGATQARAYEMAVNLVRMGHEVTVICEVPNHPKGEIFPGFRGRWLVRRQEKGVRVRHVWVYTSRKKNFRTRMAFYLTYMLNAALVGLFTRGFDVVYASSPPLFVGVAGRLIALLRRKSFVLELRDLWPEAAVQLGELKEGSMALRLARRLEHWCYRGAKKIVVVTRGFYDALAEYGGGVYAGRLRHIPNGSSTEHFRRLERAAPRPPALEGKFVVIYAGIMGIAQGLHTVVECAEMMKGEGVVFLMVGEGPVKEELMEEVRRRGVRNVVFRDGVSREEMPGVYGMADASVVPLRRLELFTGTVPSKMFDSMACELPVLLNVDGEARRILEESGGGIFVAPEDAVELAGAVRRLKERPAEAREMGRRGRAFVERNYSRTAQAEALAKELEGLWRRGGGGGSSETQLRKKPGG
ncbi:MAG: glycosyltransferase family 4 protein [bacterium]